MKSIQGSTYSQFFTCLVYNIWHFSKQIILNPEENLAQILLPDWQFYSHLTLQTMGYGKHPFQELPEILSDEFFQPQISS